VEKATGTARYETRGEVALITLDNPPVNGMSHAVRTAALEGLDRALADANVKAIVLTGAGKAFSGGADIREFNTPKMMAEPTLRTLITAFEQSAKPVIAAMHTVAMGGGLELPLGCHFRVAAPATQVALPEVKIGLLPGAGGTQRLTRLVGTQRAFWMMATGMKVTAAQALEWGLVNEVVPADDVVARAHEIAEQLASGATRAIGLIKRLVYECWGRELPSGLLREGDAVYELLKSDDLREGFDAFREKRPPNFTGG